MVHRKGNRARHLGFTYTRKLNRLKKDFWNLDQLGNHPDKFFPSPKQDGWMKTAWRELLLEESRSSKICPLPVETGQDPRFTFGQWWAQNPSVPELLLQSLRRFAFWACASVLVELNMSVRDMWVQHSWIGTVEWGGVGIAQSWLYHISPICSMLNRWSASSVYHKLIVFMPLATTTLVCSQSVRNLWKFERKLVLRGTNTHTKKMLKSWSENLFCWYFKQWENLGEKRFMLAKVLLYFLWAFRHLID